MVKVYSQAKKHLKHFLTISNNDASSVAVTHGQLGFLAMKQGALADAERHYLIASNLFSDLDEPESEANILNNLGEVYRSLQAWEQAESAHRKAAEIREINGNLTAAAASWNNLGLVAQCQGKSEVAENWFCKAIAYHRKTNSIGLAISLINLAGLLVNQPERLNDAQQYANEALSIMQSLDEASVEIWKAYDLLSSIAYQQKNHLLAKDCRQLSRYSFLRFAGMPYQMRQHKPFIVFVLESLKAKQLEELQTLLQQMPADWQSLTYAIEKILNNERDPAILLEPLDYEEAAIIHLILKGIANPESLETLFNA